MNRTTAFFIFLVLLMIGTVPTVIAQTTEDASDSQIVLPDVQTDVSDQGVQLEEESIPSFSTVLPESSAPLPVLPSVDVSDNVSPVTVYQDEAQVEKQSIFLEGQIGAGWPGLFIGDFSVYQDSGESPFSVNFSHETLNGYGLHKPETGYSESSTSLVGIKRFFISELFCIDINAGYNTSSFGLQGNSPFFHSMSRQRVVGEGMVTMVLPYGFETRLGASGDWMNIYGVVTGTVPSGVDSSSILFTVNPKGELSWIYGSFELSLLGNYDLTAFWSSRQTAVNRGDIGITALWTYENTGLLSKLRLEGTGDVIIADNRAVVPFSVKVATDFDVPFADAPLSVELSGGIKSQQTPVADLQTLHPYVVFSELPVEESDAFFDGTIKLPFASFAMTTMKANYAHTIWNNGILRPDFTSDASLAFQKQTGLFSVKRINRTSLTTDFALEVQSGLFAVAAGWQSSWLDREDDECANSVYAAVTVHATSGKWGAATDAVFNIDNRVVDDLIPELSLSAFYRISNSFSLSVELSDLIKLVTASDRQICSPYIKRGGIAELTIKLFF